MDAPTSPGNMSAFDGATSSPASPVLRVRLEVDSVSIIGNDNVIFVVSDEEVNSVTQNIRGIISQQDNSTPRPYTALINAFLTLTAARGEIFQEINPEHAKIVLDAFTDSWELANEERLNAIQAAGVSEGAVPALKKFRANARDDEALLLGILFPNATAIIRLLTLKVPEYYGQPASETEKWRQAVQVIVDKYIFSLMYSYNPAYLSLQDPNSDASLYGRDVPKRTIDFQHLATALGNRCSLMEDFGLWPLVNAAQPSTQTVTWDDISAAFATRQVVPPTPKGHNISLFHVNEFRIGRSTWTSQLASRCFAFFPDMYKYETYLSFEIIDKIKQEAKGKYDQRYSQNVDRVQTIVRAIYDSTSLLN